MRLSLPISSLAYYWEEVCTYMGYPKQDTTVKIPNINELEGRKRTYRLLSAETLLGTAAVLVALWPYYESFCMPRPIKITHTPNDFPLFPVLYIIFGSLICGHYARDLDYSIYAR